MSSNAYGDAFRENSSTLEENISQAATQVKEKMSDLGEAAAEKVDECRDATAGGLEKAGAVLRESSRNLPGGGRVSGMARAAADSLSTTADYVREHDSGQMLSDMERLVKNNPGPALLAAAAIGFLVGRAFKKV
jgi:ElaB/YqjD/DUF883 family membrane-anchored ribosome-binding protein